MKLKGIDGGPHKRWSMWFNSTQRAEPYQGLTWGRIMQRCIRRSNTASRTGAAWLSSARVVRCWVKSRNERNPCPWLLIQLSRGTAGDNPEEGADDVKSSWPLHLGLHTCYNGRHKGKQSREVERIPKVAPSSDRSLQPDSLKPESLVIADQHAAVNTFPGLVHTARQAMGGESAPRRAANPQGSRRPKRDP